MTEELNESDESLLKAAQYLKEGQLVAFPTETVYGLGASIRIPEAISAIFKAKGRANDNPLIAHISSLDQVKEIAIDIPPQFFQLTSHFFPGALTIVLKKHPSVSLLVSGGHETIAFRMPSHPTAKKLIELVGEPLVAPSANLSGKPSSTSAEHVLHDFQGIIKAVIDGGRSNLGLESTVISLLNDEPVLLRPGSIRKESIEEVLKRPVLIYHKKEGEAIVSPGLKYRHYAPNAKVLLFDSKENAFSYCLNFKNRKRLLLANDKYPFFEFQHPLNDYSLYESLRFADKMHFEEIVVILDEQIRSNSALFNRLERAAEYQFKQ